MVLSIEFSEVALGGNAILHDQAAMAGQVRNGK